MNKFNPHNREHNIHWSINQIKTLITTAQSNQSSSFIVYAALECRNIIERIEYEILVIPNHEIYKNWEEEIKQFKGIQKVNAKLKTLKYRYQTFTEAFSKAILKEYPIDAFNLKISESFENKLSKYIHTYYRSEEEIAFESEFMQNGINLMHEIIEFLEKFRNDGEFVFGSLLFSSLKGGIKKEFESWLNSVDEDTESLKNRLININEIENKGKKVTV